ncbi:hypothetical protein [Streptomyces nigrescens]
MRDLIACLWIWAGEPLRRALRAAYQHVHDWFTPPPPPPQAPVIRPAPTYRRDPRSHLRAPREFINSDVLDLVPAYYRKYEATLTAATTG